MSQMYVGTVIVREPSRQATEWKVVVFDEAGARPLELHERHSPDGHSWGYGGSGPAQLALDLLWDATGLEPSRTVYQVFMRQVVARWNKDSDWQMPAAKIIEWLADHFPALYRKDPT